MIGETHEIGAGIKRSLCSACGAVAAIDLRYAKSDHTDEVDVPARKSLWQ